MGLFCFIAIPQKNNVPILYSTFKEQSYDAMGHDYQSAGPYQKTSIYSGYGDYDPVTVTKAYSDIEYRLTSATSTCSSAPTLSTTFSYAAGVPGPGCTTVTTMPK